jgi:DNA mismatch repair protein MutL
MNIKKLPEYLINKLKAGEIVERPVSVVKEVVENALDAKATKIQIEIVDGGKKLIKISDNGTGIESEDIDLVLERYATSKISSEEDLFNIHTYGFRGEALASIAEVSKCTIQTKTENNPIAIQSSKINGQVLFTKIPFINPHGTTVIIEDLFYNTPARLKFLKSEQTEYVYIYQLFVDYVLVHRDKSRSLKKNGHMVFDLSATDSLLARFAQMYKADRVKNVKVVEGQSGGGVQLTGLAGDSSLSFSSAENIKLYVNHRPVQDRILKKALMTAYERQIKPGEHPLCILFLQIHPDLVDVNVHPRKSEVKFLDPNAVFQYTLRTLGALFGSQKIIAGSHGSGEYTSSF